MAEGGASEGFASLNVDHNGARNRDSYFHMTDSSKSAVRENEEEFKRVKADFLRVARQNRREGDLSRSESSRSPSPIRQFNQLETQFDLPGITDDDERYRLTCATLSGEVASDVRDILLQRFLSHKYISLKGVLIERRGLTTPE